MIKPKRCTDPEPRVDTTTTALPSSNETTTTVAAEHIPFEMRQYPRTTDYHWPDFNRNATGISGEWTNGEGLGTGPIGFGFSVKLTEDSV